jgi:hypothetical protein
VTIATNVLSAVVGDVELDVKDGTATLDEGWAPYVKASLTIALPDETTQALLDPRIDPRITITTTRSVLSGTAFAPQSSRTFDVLVRSRVIDHNANTMDIDLGSDEFLLQDKKLVATAPDASMLVHQASARAICTAILADIGAPLEAGTTDADVTTTSTVTNIHEDPAATGITYWSSGSINTTVTHSSSIAGGALAGQTYNNVACTANGNHLVHLGDGSAARSVNPGDVVTVSVYADPTTASITRTANIHIRWYDSTGTQIGNDYISPNIGLPYSVWTRGIYSATAPVGAVNFRAFVQFVTVASASNIAVSQAQITVNARFETNGVTPLAWFSGATATDAHYDYDWDGAVNASSSHRTPLIDRTPDALTRQPGQSWWDLLAPILQQVGLRLFCDEARAWRLVDSTYSIDGRVTVAAGFNAYTAQDTINRDATADDGTPLWFDACVIKYTWTDATGMQRTTFDAYGIDGYSQVAYFEEQRAFPGPGVAQYRVQRTIGQGRTLALDAAVDYGATPGMEAVASLPGIEDQTGYTSSITWNFSDDTMTVGTRGLIDTPDSAWIKLPTGEAWNDSPVGQSWTSEVI